MIHLRSLAHIVWLAAGLLAGCAMLEVPAEEGERLQMTPPPTSDAALADEVPEAVPAPVVRPDGPPEPAAAPRLRPQIVSRTAEELMGLTPEQIERLLGPPNAVRHETPAITWHYEEGPCKLDFQFFQDIQSGLFRALKYEANGASADGCLARIERREGG